MPRFDPMDEEDYLEWLDAQDAAEERELETDPDQLDFLTPDERDQAELEDARLSGFRSRREQIEYDDYAPPEDL